MAEEGKGIDFRAIERKWQKRWEEGKIYAFDAERKGPVFSIDTPPPTVSGRMHLGHAFSYAHADFIARFKRMKGFNVFYPFGFDDNGLATERLVEKSRKIRAKDFSRNEFIKICLEETKKHEEIMHSDFGSLGLSVDWKLLYRTIDSLARKTSQKSFLEIYKMKRAYRKEAPTMWCPTCETTIAQAELEDLQKGSEFVYITFNVDGGKKITIATTRPELMPACVAIHVHPEDERYKGFIGKEAEIPFFNRKVKIYANRSAAMDFGTGAVYHCTFGDLDDVEWIMEYNLPIIEIIGRDGRFNEKAGKYRGMKSEEARKAVIEDLQNAGHIQKIEPITHVVNVHERCKTPIEILTTKQWFVKYLDLKEEFIRKGKELNWRPEHMRVRYENWVNGLKWDWSVSRQRFFGVPFPVWYCKKCETEIVAEEKQLPVDPLEDKPPVNKCPKCGSLEFVPEKDVLDTWMTSSLTPQINSDWAENSPLHKKIFPMSLRPQAHDIITLWAFNTVVKAHFHEKKLPWKDIMISGHALDSKGRKMSKSLGNAVNPVEMIEKYSADMLRYWAASGTLGEDLPFQEKEFIAGKKFLTKLSNAARFVAMKTGGIKISDFEKEGKNLNEIDKWILSRFEKVKREATEALERYEYSKALGAARNFFWLEFADYYIEMVKYRVYSEGAGGKTAKAVLLKIMTELLKIFAPFVPHTTEEIFTENFAKLAGKGSIHLEKWPESEKGLLNDEAEKSGDIAKNIVSALRKFKSEKNMAMNAELGEVKVAVADEKLLKAAEKILEDVRQTMNVKKISVVKGKSGKGGKWIEAGEGISLEISEP
ncbi:MAG TPA: valine--tRNA ligase [archaeon]|nr:valine--tRNA ligase [archaeon]